LRSSTSHFHATSSSQLYTPSLHDALPILWYHTDAQLSTVGGQFRRSIQKNSRPPAMSRQPGHRRAGAETGSHWSVPASTRKKDSAVKKEKSRRCLYRKLHRSGESK